MMPIVFCLTVEPAGFYAGHDVSLSGRPLGRRPYDGSDSTEVFAEVADALAGLLREKLGWPVPDEDEDL